MAFGYSLNALSTSATWPQLPSNRTSSLSLLLLVNLKEIGNLEQDDKETIPFREHVGGSDPGILLLNAVCATVASSVTPKPSSITLLATGLLATGLLGVAGLVRKRFA